MAPVQITPRPLNASERAVLEFILQADVPGAGELRSQLDRTKVVAIWSPGSVSVDLQVHESHAPADLASSTLPVGAEVYDEQGGYIGELLVWVVDGPQLAALEFAWVTDDPPVSLPQVEQLRIR